MAATQPPAAAAVQATTAAQTPSMAVATPTTAAAQPRGLIMLFMPRTIRETNPRTKTSINADKYTSKLLLQRVHATSNLADAKDFTKAVVKLYSGNGLHPLSAIEKLATFTEAFDVAVDQLFDAFAKAASLDNYRDHAKFCKSISKPQGAFGRYIKNFDQALTWMISTHWLHLVKEGRDLTWLPMYLDSRIRGTWDNLLDAFLQPFEPRGALSKTVPKIFGTSLGLLKFCQERCIAGIKVLRVAGHRLPPELVNMIQETAIGRGEFMKMVAYMLSADEVKNLRMIVAPTNPLPSATVSLRQLMRSRGADLMEFGPNIEF